MEGIEAMMRWLGERRATKLAVDVETTGLNAGRDYIRLCQFGDGEQGWALDYRDYRGIVREVVEKYDRPMVAHNLLYDSKMLKKDGIVLPQKLMHDTMVQAHLYDASARMDLKGCCVKYVDRRAAIGQNMLGEAMSKGGWTWATIPTNVPAYWLYSTLDTCLTSLLDAKLYPETGGGPYREAYELELAVIHCLREAELAGLTVDEEYRQHVEDKLTFEIGQLLPQIPIDNPGSDTQVVRYLQSLGATWEVYTETGNLSVDKSVLKWLASQGYAVASVISEWRQKTKLLGSYIEKMAEYGTEKGLAVDGVMRCNTRPVEARTGRMSVTDPPLQQLPRGRVVRDGIIARPGHVFVMADFDNMEMRALASLAQDETMLAAFARGEDMHEFTAKSIWGDGYVRGTHRPVAKGVGFGKVYGAGIPKMAATAGVDIETMTAVNEQYETLFPGVKRFMENSVQLIWERAGGRRKKGWVELQDGRRLPVEADKAYVSVNYRIQGGCAVTTKKKIVELDNAGIGDYFRLAVHDELIYEVPHEDAPLVQEIIERVMPEHGDWPGVVLGVDSDIVQRWGQHYREDFDKYVETEDPEWLATA